MKLLRRQKEKFVFEMGSREKALLLAVLELFPLVPLTHHRLSKDAAEIPDAAASQHLLEESLKVQQTESRQWLTALLEQAGRFKPAQTGFHFTITRAEMETLLQILNDVRVGSWLALGAPEMEDETRLLLNEASALHVHRMHLAGLFQSFFLETVSAAG